MSYDKTETAIPTLPYNGHLKEKGREEGLRPPGEEQLRERGTAQDDVHGMRQELLQPTEKIGGILWRPYVPRGTKKLSEVK